MTGFSVSSLPVMRDVQWCWVKHHDLEALAVPWWCAETSGAVICGAAVHAFQLCGLCKRAIVMWGQPDVGWRIAMSKLRLRMDDIFYAASTEQPVSFLQRRWNESTVGSLTGNPRDIEGLGAPNILYSQASAQQRSNNLWRDSKQ